MFMTVNGRHPFYFVALYPVPVHTPKSPSDPLIAPTSECSPRHIVLFVSVGSYPRSCPGRFFGGGIDFFRSQGMNFVALALLEACSGDDEKAFWVLAGMCDRLDLEVRMIFFNEKQLHIVKRTVCILLSMTVVVHMQVGVSNV